jgi:hypothetical protein
MHCGVEVAESSTNKQHHLSHIVKSRSSLVGFRVLGFVGALGEIF